MKIEHSRMDSYATHIGVLSKTESQRIYKGFCREMHNECWYVISPGSTVTLACSS